MGWAIGYDDNWRRDIGYGVPCVCDHPKCNAKIDRGLSYVCGYEPYGGERGCGLYFCGNHLSWDHRCPRCVAHKAPYKRPKPDIAEWIRHKLTDESWQQWRDNNPAQVTQMQSVLASPQESGSSGSAL